MKQKNILKFLILSLCLIFVFCLTACKQDTTNPKHDSSTATSSDKAIDNSSQDIISGIELEEDIFDNSTTQCGSSNGVSSNNTSSTISSSDAAVGENVSSDNTSNDTSSEQNPDAEDSNSSQEGVVVEDGVIKLPIDKFD